MGTHHGRGIWGWQALERKLFNHICLRRAEKATLRSVYVTWFLVVSSLGSDLVPRPGRGQQPGDGGELMTLVSQTLQLLNPQCQTSETETGHHHPLQMNSNRPTLGHVFELLKTKDKKSLERSRKRFNLFWIKSSIIISSQLLNEESRSPAETGKYISSAKMSNKQTKSQLKILYPVRLSSKWEGEISNEAK